MMMSFHKKIIASAILVQLGFGSQFAFSDDGLTPGPGLFSGKQGEFSVAALLPSARTNQSERKSSGGSSTASSSDSKELNATTVDFKTYQEWRILNKANPALYANFAMYLEYKEFLQSAKRASID